MFTLSILIPILLQIKLYGAPSILHETKSAFYYKSDK